MISYLTGRYRLLAFGRFAGATLFEVKVVARLTRDREVGLESNRKRGDDVRNRTYVTANTIVHG